MIPLARPQIENDDLRAATILYDCPGVRGSVVNIASGHEVSVNELVSMILRTMGAEDHPVVHGRTRPGDVRRHLADISRARALLGFEPRIDLASGLRRTVQWYLSGGGP